MINAQLCVVSALGGGTKIAVDVPLQTRHANQSGALGQIGQFEWVVADP
jgi:hypothetical protein